MNTVELNSINLQSIDVASNDVSSIGKSIKRNKGTTLLPSEYQQVEYIEFSGTQYIDTGFKANTTTTRAETELQVTGTSRTCGVFGSRNSSTSTNTDSCNVFLLDTNKFRLDWINGSTSVLFTDVVITEKYVISITRGTTTINNATFTSTNTDSINQDYNFYIGSYNRPGGAPSNRFTGRFYWFKIYSNNQLVRDFIPCYRISDNVIGMYDVVNDVFYTNQGTGTFLKGANVNKKYSPYIKGHITSSDSTFTFGVDGNNKTVPIDANGDFKVKVKKPITSLSFVGVPQLESLELFAINGVTTFDVDYPIAVNYIRCDSTTKNAKNDIYHIRGTATEDFDFTLKYVDDNNNETTVTESALIDENGKWDVSYWGKKIKSLQQTFNNNKVITSVEFTEKLQSLTAMAYCFNAATNLTNIKYTKDVEMSSLLGMSQAYYSLTSLVEIENMPTFGSVVKEAWGAFRANGLKTLNLGESTFENVSDVGYIFNNCSNLEDLIIPKVSFKSATSANDIIGWSQKLKNIVVPNDSSFPFSIDLSKPMNLSYDSMLNVANWLKDYSTDPFVKIGKQSQNNWNNKTMDWYVYENEEYVVASNWSSTAIYYKLETQTITFRTSTYNALTAEQKAELEGIIVTQKGWTLATA